MADLGSLGRVNLSQIGSLGRVNIGSIGAINKIQVVSSIPDSISLDIEYLDFYVDGTPILTNTIYVTASGSWTTTYLDDGDGIFFSCYPTSNGSSSNVTIYCDTWDSPFGSRTGRIQFTRDSAYVDLTITQYDYL
jgi:hypothetical protein